MHQPTMVAAPIPQPPWYPTPGFEAHNNQPTCRFATGLHHKKMYYLLYYYYIQRIDNNGQQCGCKQWCLQLSVGRLRWFWHNSFVLWTYWHCLGAWFQRQRRWQGRQSEHWPRWGNFGESTMVDLLHWWVRMKSIHKYNNRQLIYWFGLTTRTFGVETFVFWPHIVW